MHELNLCQGVSTLSKQGERRAGVSRRAFLGTSVTATVGSIAMPAFGLSTATAEASEPQTSLQPSAIAFRAAKPIWPRGREKEMNLFVGFRVVFEGSREQEVYLRVAGATLYRIYLNGEFLAWGPARGPYGYFRTDLFNLAPLLADGKNILCVEVAGYNVNSFYVLNQPSFLQAEVTTGSSVLASTGGTGNAFEATILSERLQKAQRYSFQRSFSEVYRMDSRLAYWRERGDASFPTVECSSFASPTLIQRRVPYPAY